MTSSCGEERAEVGAVLDSGIFLRAPNLESFFRYICEQSFLGEANQLKEYSVAVEALNRDPQFDPKKDSIVRVEAHRLRKRLGEYYAGEGAKHQIHITVPRGSYAPQFVRVEPECTIAVVRIEPDVVLAARADLNLPVVVAATETHPESYRHPRLDPRSRFVQLGFAAALLLIGCTWLVSRALTSAGTFARTDEGNAVSERIAPPDFRILPGYFGEPFPDEQGREWSADAHFSGGHAIPVPDGQAILGLPGSHFIKSGRAGRFRYDVPTQPGIYEVHLYFAETEFGFGNPKGGGDSSRVFRLEINGVHKIDLFDVHSQAGGPNRILVRVFKDISPSRDGKIHIAIDPVTEMGFVNAIEILPSTAGHIRPLRIVAQPHPVTDSKGQIWSADEYVLGGMMTSHAMPQLPDSQFLFCKGERFGNFSYHLPLAPGHYRLSLYFAETWFGTSNSKGDEQEQRLFDVFANGVALVRKFDVLHEAGAPNRPVKRVFEGLQPNAQGELALEFVPVSNYAEVNAIEVEETD